MALMHMLFAYMHFLDPQQVTFIQCSVSTYAFLQDQMVYKREQTGQCMFPMQAADIVFTNAVQPIDPLQIPLHRVLATGYAAAAHTFWTLKARVLVQALLEYEYEIVCSMLQGELNRTGSCL